eukprot:TRINITY_DN34215_c0_g1_i1.p5 TRINITY_DN34215_c0_g1~~TRINITY_DN34215_c0_g1_i1.p5  ORF type:complete len:112 (+),score=31.97 TRINITY_DN34215_c0_g1_i1:487-822(+)
MQLFFFAGVVVFIFGADRILPQPIGNAIQQNQQALGILMVICLMGAGKLMATGAFEIDADGQTVWSKLETGGLPHPNELLTRIGKQYGLGPPPQQHGGGFGGPGSVRGGAF